MLRRAAALLLIPALLLLSTGCWGKIELNEIGIITITGVDTEPDGKVRVTVMSTQPEGPPNTPMVKSITWIGTATGTDLVDASKNLRSTAVKRLSWVHNSIIIIGRDAAKNKMTEIIDFFTRNREIRFSCHVLVAEGRALDILQTPAQLQRDLYIELEGMIRNMEDWSKSYSAKVKEFIVSYSDKCGDLVTGKVWYRDEQMDTFSTNREGYDKLLLKGQKIPLAYVDGAAVFKKGSFVGWLDGEETRGYLWITGKVRPGAVIMAGLDGSLAMESTFSSSSIDMKLEKGSIIAHVKVDIRGLMMEETSNLDIRKLDVLHKVEDGFEAAVKSDMEKAVQKIQKEYNSDAFQFFTQLNRKYPEVWKTIKKDWENGFFQKVKIEYEVKVTVERTGEIIRTIT